MKKQLLFLITILLPLLASAYDFEIKNEDGVYMYFNYINDGKELEVTSRFTGADYEDNITIPNEVTYMNKTRKVTRIGKLAFSQCVALTSVITGNNMTCIDQYAFRNCSGLTSVTIGNSVTSIGNGAFYGCSKLTSITIPNSVTSIGEKAFYGCSKLTFIAIPNSVTKIDDSTFRDCHSLISATIPNSVRSIGKYAFLNCYSLSSITIPNNVTSINNYAFYECSALSLLTLGKSVSSIGLHVFDGADISTILSLIENPFAIYSKTSENRTFSLNTYYNATLYVPKGTIDKYKATNGWKDFTFIEEGIPAGISSCKMDKKLVTKSYNIDGKVLDKPQKGLNIVKKRDGTTRKVILK